MHDLAAYWSIGELQASFLIALHVIGALILGTAIGYERSYRGHAAGMRTYSLVCVASTLTTVICGFPTLWFGGSVFSAPTVSPAPIIQGIMAGIGFLGAGVIMKEGMSIRGLSTAASVWMTAAIGVALGVGFYVAAIVTTIVVVAVMSAFRQLEARFAHQTEFRLMLNYSYNEAPDIRAMKVFIQGHHMIVTGWSYHHDQSNGTVHYDLILRSTGPDPAETLTDGLLADSTITSFTISPTRS